MSEPQTYKEPGTDVPSIHVEAQLKVETQASDSAKYEEKDSISEAENQVNSSVKPNMTSDMTSDIPSSIETGYKTLQVSPLDHNVTETAIRAYFERVGKVTSVSFSWDKAKRGGQSYAFVEYEEEASARRALEYLENEPLNGGKVWIKWAYQSQKNQNSLSHQYYSSYQTQNPSYNHSHYSSYHPTTKDNSFNIFIGDLATEVDDELLAKAFGQLGFSSILEAKVMWDMTTGRSRGYGFVSFRDRDEAEKALEVVNGMMIGSRAVRCNWAQRNLRRNRLVASTVSVGASRSGTGSGKGSASGSSLSLSLSLSGGRQGHGYIRGQRKAYVGVTGQGCQEVAGAIGAAGVPGPHQQIAQNIQDPQDFQDLQAPHASMPFGTPMTYMASPHMNHSHANHSLPPPPPPPMYPNYTLINYEAVLNQSPHWQTTVYLGNLAPFTPTQALMPLIKSLGLVADIKHQQERGFAFVKYDSHETAAMVIMQLTGYHINGRVVRVGWARSSYGAAQRLHKPATNVYTNVDFV